MFDFAKKKGFLATKGRVVLVVQASTKVNQRLEDNCNKKLMTVFNVNDYLLMRQSVH